MKEATITSIRPNGVSNPVKVGDGEYKVKLGALNVYNESKLFYVAKWAIDVILDKNSLMNELIRGGMLYSELEHPVRPTGCSDYEYLAMLAKAPRLDKACCLIKSITVRDTGIRSAIPTMGNVYAIEGVVKPHGAHRDVFLKLLEDDDVNVCFSIRARVTLKRVNRIKCAIIDKVMTFDMVSAPGIPEARQWNEVRAGVESIDLCSFSPSEVMEESVMDSKFNKEVVGCESDRKMLSDIIRPTRTLITHLDGWK